jgi:hypothetical protein
MKTLKTLAFLSLTLILLSGITATFAQSTWTGNTNTDWSTASNWNPAGLPTSNDDVIIPTSPSGGNMPTISTGLYTISSLEIQASAILTQTGGIITTEDIEIKDGGSYIQSDGELNVPYEFICDVGNTFAATGGTVHFSGAAGGGAGYSGSIQFHNVLIDDGADPKFDNGGKANTIKISGNFTNNNADMGKVKGTTFIFNGTGNQTIYSAIVPTAPNYDESTFGSLVIDKPSGALTLLSDISVFDAFTPQQGYLDLDGNTLYVDGEVYEGPLPVELSSFSAINLENGIKLKWRTETEVSN